MVSDRSAAKGAIKETSSEDPELEAAFSAGEDYKLKHIQEQNRHAETMHRQGMGFLGRWLGGESSAPMFIAALATAAGLAGAFFCWYHAIGTTDHPIASEVAEFWSKQAERALAFGAAALAFIFGRGGK